MTTRETPGSTPAARLPPQDLDAEQALLGSMMLDRDAAGLVLQIIPRDESNRFYRPDHRKLFELLVDVYDANQPMDIIVVRDELQRRKHLDEVGGLDYLTELVESVPSAVHAEHYARIVRDKSLLRDLIACSGRTIEAAYDHREQAQQILDTAEQRLFEVTFKRISNPVVKIQVFVDEIFAKLQEREDSYLTGVATGFTELDDLMSGLQPGELIIVAARPSMGKTALGLSIAEHVAVAEQRPVAFFSMEMSRQQIAQRVLCARGRVDSHRVRRNRLNETEMMRLQHVADELGNKPFFVDDTPGMSVMELRAKARRLKMIHDIDLVVVDYLQLMGDSHSARESRQHEIATISRGLKALARELRIPVLALAQLNRNPEGREGNRPRMSDLRESGAIEQDADTIILLHREEYYLKDRKDEKSREMLEKVRGVAELIVAKQRNGPTGTVSVQFHQSFTAFDNLSVAPEPDDRMAPIQTDAPDEITPF